MLRKIKDFLLIRAALLFERGKKFLNNTISWLR